MRALQRDRDRQAVDVHLRRALEVALENSPPTSGGFGPVIGALAAMTNDWVDRLSYDMAVTAIGALIRGTAKERDAVRAWHARRHGCSDISSDALAVLDTAAAVDRTAYLYPRGDPALVTKGRVAVDQLREHLVQRLGSSVPSADDLEDWIGRHAAKKARGKLTTAGVVAKIVHRGRLLGARGGDEPKTLRRVTMVLKRHHYTGLVK